jgi:hypothetical protein
MDTVIGINAWSEEEIEATVEAYFQMLLSEKSGQPMNKAHVNRVLREGPLSGRTKGSIEFRMQNISTVFEQLGIQRISGYKPSNNIGANVSNSIRNAVVRLTEFDISKLGPEWFERQKSSFLFNYLTTHSSEAIRTTKELSAEASDLDSYAENQSETLANRSKLEEEIVSVIERGGKLTELSVEAHRYLTVFLSFFWEKLQKFLNIVALIALITTYQNNIDASKTSEEIRSSVRALSKGQRAFLQGQSIVTGHEVILRKEPNKNSAELTRLEKGVWIENLEGDTSDWIHVRAEVNDEHIDGWIYRSYLVKI